MGTVLDFNVIEYTYASHSGGAGKAREPGISLRRKPSMAYYVYLLASRKDGALYIGVTNDLVRRLYQHRTKSVPGFTSRYNITKLVWFEAYDDPVAAISREKEIKKWRRAWKIWLIETNNPDWKDLYESIAQ